MRREISIPAQQYCIDNLERVLAFKFDKSVSVVVAKQSPFLNQAGTAAICKGQSGYRGEVAHTFWISALWCGTRPPRNQGLEFQFLLLQKESLGFAAMINLH